MRQDPRYRALQKAMRDLLRTVTFPCAVHAELLDGGDRCVVFSFNGTTAFGAASIIKLPILVCIAQLVESGKLDWNQPVSLTVGAPHGTGLLELLDGSRDWSVHDLCVMMMGVSDNMACNQLLELVQMERANEILRSLGYNATVIRRKMMDRDKLARGIDNTVTALETSDMLARLYEGRLISPTASERILSYLRMDQLRDLIAWPLPGSAVLAGKTGGMPGSLLDAELVTASATNTYSLCVFASGFDRAIQAKRLIAQISETVYEAVVRGDKCHQAGASV